MKLLLRIVLVIGVLLFVGLAAYYWLTPANQLLHIMPGYDPSLTTPHTKHALAAGILALGCLVGLWFTTGKKHADDSSSAAVN